MPQEDRLKCAECTRRGKPCVEMSWDAVERTKENLKAEVARGEQEVFARLRELSELQARLDRKRKVLEQAQQRSDRQAQCLIREMEEGGEDLSRTVFDVSLLDAQLADPFGGTSVGVLDMK